jgi:hypothetical protein
MGGRFRGPFPSGEFVQVIAERAIGGEGFLVEQPLGATAQANLYEYPCPPIGQLILPCRQPRNAKTATPGRLLATTPSYHQLDFLSFSGFSCSTRSVIRSPGTDSCCLIKIGRIEAGEQNLKGRRLGIPTPRVSAGHPKSPKRTCTNGHCGTHPKTITLEIGSSGLS